MRSVILLEPYKETPVPVGKLRLEREKALTLKELELDGLQKMLPEARPLADRPWPHAGVQAILYPTPQRACGKTLLQIPRPKGLHGPEASSGAL